MICSMKIRITGKVEGIEKYHEIVDLGQGVLQQGEFKNKIMPAIQRINIACYNDYTFDILSADNFPDLTISLTSEQQCFYGKFKFVGIFVGT